MSDTERDLACDSCSWFEPDTTLFSVGQPCPLPWCHDGEVKLYKPDADQ